eukprot:TRINITY_DN9629_c0_g1_i1.p1 TRINITY_DN9629_c0_g1~~TRINITY_DN9629_c0_g1_i1.p1  ORF type:complete len:1032 (-),score=136.43 TRINITY_DN9629_c0_g1_i1:240-3284(-)
MLPLHPHGSRINARPAGNGMQTFSMQVPVAVTPTSAGAASPGVISTPGLMPAGVWQPAHIRTSKSVPGTEGAATSAFRPQQAGGYTTLFSGSNLAGRRPDGSKVAAGRPLASLMNMGSVSRAETESTMSQWRPSVSEFRPSENRDEHLAEDTPWEGLETVRDMASFRDSSESDSESGSHSCSYMGGLHQWNPEAYHWITARMGSKKKICLVVALMLLEAAEFVLGESAFTPGVNVLSILVVGNFTSLLLASFICLFLEGNRVVSKLLSWHHLWRFMVAAILFTVASAFVLLAYRIGTSRTEVATFGYSYMPIAAVLSYFAFRRNYGRLEWLSIGMMTLGVLAFVLLREESREQKELQFKSEGFVLIMVSVASSVTGSILVERIFKDRSNKFSSNSNQHDRFYIMKFHLDLSALAVALLLWVMPWERVGMVKDFMQAWEKSSNWFGNWGRYQFIMVLVKTGQGWTAGLLTKEFSTVIKSIVQTLAVVSVMFVGDPLRGDRFHFAQRCVPSLLLATVIFMSAVIFQTGRVNLKLIRKACNIDSAALPQLRLSSLAKPEDSGGTPLAREASSGKVSESDSASEALPAEHIDQAETLAGYSSESMLFITTTYALMLVYIVSDAGRTLLLQKALSTTVTNSTVMGLVCYIIGAVIASCLTLYTDGWEGLSFAWSPRRILRCLPASFLFALATCLGNLAFAMGISSALYLVLGKFYTPVAAFCARWIMGKFYMWLEWFAIIILTISSATFGILQAYSIQSGIPHLGSIIAMCLVLGSAAVSALASLATERILKDDTEKPFHLLKVSLDVGSVLSSLVLIPVVGHIASRPQDIPWVSRPESYDTCPRDSVCWDLSVGTCSNAACSCPCVEGIFAGWHNWVLFMAVAVNTIQGWMVGKVTQRFSVLHRAIADSFSLLGIYFIGDPLLNGKSLDNHALNLVAMVVPLSTATFSVASSEMQSAFEAQRKLTQGTRLGKRMESVDFDSDDEAIIMATPSLTSSPSRHFRSTSADLSPDGSPHRKT